MQDLVHPNRMDPENVKHNPNHCLPTLFDKAADLNVSESHTILRYLAEKFLPNSHWYPNDLTARTRINNYLDWHAFTIRFTFMTIGQCFLPCFTPEGGLKPEKQLIGLSADTIWGSQHPLWAGRADNGLHNQLMIINDYWLAKNDFVAGAAVSIADLTLYADCGYIIHLFGIDLKGYPKVNAWYKNMEANFGQLPARKAFIPHMEYFGREFQPLFPKGAIGYAPHSPTMPSPVPNIPANTSAEKKTPAKSSAEKKTPAKSTGEQKTPAKSSGEQKTPVKSVVQLINRESDSPVREKSGKERAEEVERSAEREKYTDNPLKDSYLDPTSLPDPQ